MAQRLKLRQRLKAMRQGMTLMELLVVIAVIMAAS